jgi:hypothetical protein
VAALFFGGTYAFTRWQNLSSPSLTLLLPCSSPFFCDTLALMGSFTAVFCTLALCVFVQAQVVQDDWLFPSEPDLFQTIPIGLAISISWDSNLQSWFQTYAPAATVTNVDLWLTDFKNHIFTHQIGSEYTKVSAEPVVLITVQPESMYLMLEPFLGRVMFPQLSSQSQTNGSSAS